jgi:hypothetical protein
MSRQLRESSLTRGALVAALCAVCISAVWAVPQDDEPTVRERRLWNKRFQEARANRKKTETGTNLASHRPAPKAPARARRKGDGDEFIGVTFWRLRPAAAGGGAGQASLVVRKADGQAERYVAERVGANESFGEGELVRMGVEVAREERGYLYVVNREVYADGRLSEPYLIFPSSTTPAGGNVVTAGRIIYLPADTDKLPYFTIQRSRAEKAHVGERLTIIVSPTPLKARGKLIRIDDRTEVIQLDAAQAEEWERAWGGAVERRETKGQLVKAWTLAEKRAGEGEGLGEDDPLPQMIYRVRPKAGAPAVAQVVVRIAP